MNIITSNGSQTYSGNAQATKTSSSSPAETSNNAAETGQQQDSDRVQISTRSQKIQQLSQEFFPGGPHEIKITPAFISRLHEYDLISASEAESLSSSAGVANDDSANNLNELAQFVDTFSEKLEEEGADTSLIDTLKQASTILDSWQGNRRTDSDALNNVVQELAVITGSEEFENFSVDEKKSLLELELAMNVAQRLNPESNVSAKVNQYLSVLNGGR